tara:strand:+ start:33 stop:683 length:651 start_codon:yes stop_codon:yes gene_type:complete
MINLNSKTILIYTLILFTSGCAFNTEQSENIDFQLSNINLTQLNTKGEELFRLKSSQANIDNLSKDIYAKDVIISLTGVNKLFNKISSRNCILLRSDNKIILSQNVKLTSFEDPNSYLKADKLIWDIDQSIVNLSGNIRLSYLRTQLESKYANYTDSLNQIIFSGLTKYMVFDKSNKTYPIIKLTSDKAIINYKSKLIKFVSSNNQVKSVVNLDLQ